jgi:hypothetical protein
LYAFCVFGFSLCIFVLGVLELDLNLYVCHLSL